MASLFDLAETLGAHIKRLGMTKQSLKAAAGLSNQTVVNVFDGRKDYKVSTLLAVADRLGLELVLVPKAAARALAPTGGQPVVATRVQSALARLGMGQADDGDPVFLDEPRS